MSLIAKTPAIRSFVYSVGERTLLSVPIVFWMGVAGFTCAALSVDSHAQEAAYQTELRSYAIAPGSLDTVLNAFTRFAGIELSVNAALTRDRRSAGLQGDYTIESGFNTILAGHGLQAVRDAQGVYLIRPLPSGPIGVSTLSAITVTSRAVDDVQNDTGLTARRATTASKTDTPLIELPQIVNVVTREQIERQGAQTVTQALGYAPGVIPAFGGSSDSRYDVLTARGGFVRDYLDGMRVPFSSYSVSVPQFEPYMLERIELLQGPASGLFGQSNTGGILNMVSRRPSAEARHELQAQIGTRRHRQLALDSTGALDDEEKFLYRITALGREADGHTDFSQDERLLIAPSFTWQASTDTKFTLLTHYQRDKAIPQYQGLPAQGTLLDSPYGQLPRERFAGEPDHERLDRKQYSIGYAFEHRFNDTWQLRQNLRYTHVDIDARGTPGYMLRNDRTLDRVATQGLGEGSIFGVDTQLQARFDTGAWQHTMLMGVDFMKQRDDYSFFSAPIDSIDLYDPVYGAPIPELIPRFSTLQRMEQAGIYIQDQAKVDRWVFTAAGRYDRVKANTYARATDTDSPRFDEAFTGKVGVNYVLENGFAPYANYSTSFEPIAGTDFDTKPFTPMRGKQLEVGVKYQPPGTDTLLTLSAYRIERRNILTPDPDHPNFSVQMGAVKIGGLALEARTPLWEGGGLIASYAYHTSEITEANPDAAGETLLGKPLERLPRHMASAWVDHAFQTPSLLGLTLGAGVRYTGANNAEPAGALRLGATTLWDAAIHYDAGKKYPAFKGVKLALTASNLTDRTYVSYCLSALQCFYGQGRTVLFNVTKQW